MTGTCSDRNDHHGTRDHGPHDHGSPDHGGHSAGDPACAMAHGDLEPAADGRTLVAVFASPVAYQSEPSGASSRSPEDRLGSESAIGCQFPAGFEK